MTNGPLVLFGENVSVQPGSVRKQGNPKSRDTNAWMQELSYTVEQLTQRLRVPAAPRKAEVRWADDDDIRRHLLRLLSTAVLGPEDREDVLRFLSGEVPLPLGYYIGEKTPHILVHEDAESYDFVLAHELGHFVDHVLLGIVSPQRGGMWSSHDCPLLEDWRVQIQATWTTQQLNEVRATGLRNGRVTQGYARYLLREHELFARSFAQFVAMELDGEAGRLRTWIERLWEADEMPLTQWNRPEFYGVGRAFERLFKSLGWTIE